MGKDKALTLLDNDDVAPFLALIDQTKGGSTSAAGDDAMDADSVRMTSFHFIWPQ